MGAELGARAPHARRTTAFVTLVLLIGCGRIRFEDRESDGGAGGDAGDRLGLTPGSMTINLGSRLQLAATGGTPPYTFSVAGGGSISSTGLFVAPSRAGTSTIAVKDAELDEVTTEVHYEGARLFVIGGDEGGAPSDVVRSSSDGITWSFVGTLPAPRANGTLVVFDDRMLYLGGLDLAFVPRDQVYASTDGVTWQAIGQLPIGVAATTATVHGGELWLAGGNTTSGNSGALHRSRDGVSWTPAGMFPRPRHEHDLISRDGRLYILGGHADSGFLDEILGSEDGATWTALADRLSFTADFPAVGELGARVVRACGDSCTQVETSTDLKTWTASTFPGGSRSGPVLVGFRGQLLMIGGAATVLASTDGLAWTPHGTLPVAVTRTAATQFTPR